MPARVLCWILNAVFPKPGWNMDQQVVNPTLTDSNIPRGLG